MRIEIQFLLFSPSDQYIGAWGASEPIAAIVRVGTYTSLVPCVAAAMCDVGKQYADEIEAILADAIASLLWSEDFVFGDRCKLSPEKVVFIDSVDSPRAAVRWVRDYVAGFV